MAELGLVSFPSGSLQLEGRLHMPAGAPPAAGAVVCHPHPLYGGDMRSSVVSTVCEALTAIGWAAFRFNFRGVGASEGSHSGTREPEDVTAALDYVSALPATAGLRLAMVGYSFGAWAGLAAGASDDRVFALVGISPPLSMLDFGFLSACAKPKLLVRGDRDSYLDAAASARYFASLPDPKVERVIAGADHFWNGFEGALSKVVAEFLTER